MESILLVIQMIIALSLIGIVLLQRSDSDGMGLGGSSGGMGLLSGRAKANVLTRTTAILAALFMINSLLFGILTSQRTSIVEKIEAQKEASALSVPGVPLADEQPVPVVSPDASSKTAPVAVPPVPSAMAPETSSEAVKSAATPKETKPMSVPRAK